MDDDQPEIISAEDACPFCHAAMTERGEHAGIWDGSLGRGFGNWYNARCRACGVELIGWEYSTDAAPDDLHMRWEGRRDGHTAT